MQKIFTNWENTKGRLDKFLNRQAAQSTLVRIATAYFTHDGLTSKPFKNTDIQLIVGFDEMLSINSTRKAYEANNISLKFYTNRFHPKIYLFDNGVVVVGSSNYTNPGIGSIKNANSECNIATDNRQTYEAVSQYFDSLWWKAPTFEKEHFEILEDIQKRVKKFDAGRKKAIEDILPFVDPMWNSGLGHKRTFVNYGAFRENFKDLSGMYFETLEPRKGLPKKIEVDVFLNWLCNVHGERKQGEIVNKNKRDQRVQKFLNEFGSVRNEGDREFYFKRAADKSILLERLLRKQNIRRLDKDSLELITKNIYSFKIFRGKFIEKNHVDDIIDSFNYLLYSNEDIRVRLHNVLDGEYKLEQFQASRALELLGWADVGFPIWTQKTSKAMAILGYSDSVNKDKILK